MLGLLNISEGMSIALHACVALAEDPERFQSVRRISARLGFSSHHAAKVERELVRSGILETRRGPAGGARLARPTTAITILEIYVAAGGRPDFKGCLLRQNICKGGGCALGSLITRENRRLAGLFRKITLADVARTLKKYRAG